MLGGDELEQLLTVNIVDISDAVFCVDAGRRIVAWNAGAERLLGYPTSEVVGQLCYEVLACGMRPDVLCASHCMLLGSSVHRPLAAVDVAVRTREGSSRHLAMSTVTARTVSGRPRIIHILRDTQSDVPLSPAAARPLVDEAPAEAPASDTGPEPRLTPRELEALRLLAQGFSTVEIADSLGVSRITARNHVTKVMDKLQVRTRLQAVVAASRRGLL